MHLFPPFSLLVFDLPSRVYFNSIQEVVFAGKWESCNQNDCAKCTPSSFHSLYVSCHVEELSALHCGSGKM